jgi:predicted RNase H-like HicB family nuclease
MTRHSEKADAERPERDQERERRQGLGIYWAHFAVAIHFERIVAQTCCSLPIQVVNHKDEIILYWSNDDEAFIAEAPELARCSAGGATRQEALANVEISEWLATARELGHSIPEPKGRLLFA